ncbi:hypothetical protein Btru_010028, partial [Bulinus truncatus]
KKTNRINNRDVPVLVPLYPNRDVPVLVPLYPDRRRTCPGTTVPRQTYLSWYHCTPTETYLSWYHCTPIDDVPVLVPLYPNRDVPVLVPLYPDRRSGSMNVLTAPAQGGAGPANMTSSDLVTATVSEMLKLVTWLSLITCTAFVYADEPSQYFNFPLTSTENVHTQPDDQSPPRLQHTKPSMLYRLSPNFDRGDNGGPLDGSLADGMDVTKRVFCNGFTGCGSFRRGSRRRPKAVVGKRLQDQAISKKPFCNSHGCFNSGKRSGELPSEDAQKFSDDEFPALMTKKLFCNGYGGCQNMGKRLLLLEKLKDRSRQWDSDSADTLGKRYWTGGFDEDVDSLVDSMSR